MFTNVNVYEWNRYKHNTIYDDTFIAEAETNMVRQQLHSFGDFSSN